MDVHLGPDDPGKGSLRGAVEDRPLALASV